MESATQSAWTARPRRRGTPADQAWVRSGEGGDPARRPGLPAARARPAYTCGRVERSDPRTPKVASRAAPAAWPVRPWRCRRCPVPGTGPCQTPCGASGTRRGRPRRGSRCRPQGQPTLRPAPSPTGSRPRSRPEASGSRRLPTAVRGGGDASGAYVIACCWPAAGARLARRGGCGASCQWSSASAPLFAQRPCRGRCRRLRGPHRCTKGALPARALTAWVPRRPA